MKNSLYVATFLLVFVHLETNSYSQNEKPADVNCNICSKTFHDLTDYLQHKKNEHVETLKECKNKECRFGEQSCWYHHVNQPK